MLQVGMTAQEYPYRKVVSLTDTLSFGGFYHKLEEGRPARLQSFITLKYSEATSRWRLIDSLPAYRLYLLGSPAGIEMGMRAFYLARKRHDTLLITAIPLHRKGDFQDLKFLRGAADSLVELRYRDHISTGESSTEFEVSAFFHLDKYAEPVARVLRKIWETEHGNYDPKCRDYRFYSVEFSREVSIGNNHLRVSPGRYKYTSNMDCNYTNHTDPVAGAIFELKDGQFIRSH